MDLVLTVGAVGLFALAAAVDLVRRRIPNPLVVALALVGLARMAVDVAGGAGVVGTGADLAAALAILAAGAGLFQAGALGGGDVKLLAAGALWVGAPGIAAYLLGTALAGGALALLYLFGTMLARGAAARGLRRGLPYGVAIAAGGILVTAAGF
jgi:prepilin peptidase CpaA